MDASRHVSGRHWLLALAAAAINWLADLACLIAAAHAFGLKLSVAELGLIYLGVQLVRQVPITPGGVGVIEASLMAGMVSAGAAQGPAAAAIIVYRLLSCWLIIPVGAVAWARLTRLTRGRPLADDPERDLVEGAAYQTVDGDQPVAEERTPALAGAA